ncbi:MAG: Gx transporter family protein [Geobacteraceae bacterium]|nr:Gx transporter family protein [Geobacteraceae bacterium]
MSNTRKLVFFSLLVALGTTLHVAEGMIPNPFPLPGVKLGLANIATLIAVYFYGLRGGLVVAVLRVVLGSLIGGVFLSPGFLMSLSGAIFSTVVMACLLGYAPCFSIKGVSVAGAVSHNIGQLLAAALLVQSQSIFYYLPFLLLAAIPTGLVTGHLFDALLIRLDKSGILHKYKERLI